MTSKERMRLAMAGQKPDRPPVMCQLSLGHLGKYHVDDLVHFWYTSEGLGEAFIKAAAEYQFDGILINTYGRNPERLANIVSVEDKPGGAKQVNFKDGSYAYIAKNDDPLYYNTPAGKQRPEDIEDLDLNVIPRFTPETLPSYQFDILKYVLDKKRDELSIHGEVGTGFEMFLDLFKTSAHGLMALSDANMYDEDADEDDEDNAYYKQVFDKVNEALELLNNYVILLATEQCKLGIDAMKLSSPFASASFISREMYEKFVLPYEKKIIAAVHQYNVPCYIHTCGAIGDRLDLMLATGTNGLECLDPPPIGTVDLKQASEELGDRAFIKGNLDSVNQLLNKTTEEVAESAREKLEIGYNHPGGYILSSACSVAPNVTPENIKVLAEVAKTFLY